MAAHLPPPGSWPAALAAESWRVLLELAPSLLLGLLIAGLLHVFLPADWIRRRLARRGFGSVLRAVLIGVPLPLCSCGVVPAAIALRRDGASAGAATGFLIATPQTGVDSILVSASFLGWPFALFKIVAAFVTGLVGGVLVDATTSRAEPAPAPAASCAPVAPGRRWLEVPRYAVGELLAMIDVWIVLGVAISALLTVFLPPGALAGEAWATGLLGMLVVLLVALPLYVCAVGSVPIAAALVAAGMPLGTALVFLMAGPASNVATIGAIARAFGRRVVIIYVAVVSGMSLLLGWAFDSVLPADLGRHAQHIAHHDSASPLAIGSAVLLVALLAWLIGRRLVTSVRRHLASTRRGTGVELVVIGMSCGNCVAHVERALRAVAGVEAVAIDLASGRVTVSGRATAAALTRAIEDAGYAVETRP